MAKRNLLKPIHLLALGKKWLGQYPIFLFLYEGYKARSGDALRK
jgi:hypothetical protein